jgi:hypothetical protein
MNFYELSQIILQENTIKIIDNAGYKDITGVRRIPVAKIIDPKTKKEKIVVGNKEIDEAKARIPGKPTMLDSEMKKLFNGSELVIEEKVDGHPIIIIKDGFTFFCESLKVKHSVEYENIPYSIGNWPDMVVCYDVIDGELSPPYKEKQGTGRWLNRKEKETICEEVGSPVVPLIWKGVVSPQDLPKLADRISSFGSRTAEGIVLKNYTSGVFGKFINIEFQKKISDEAIQGGIHPMRLGILNFRR